MADLYSWEAVVIRLKELFDESFGKKGDEKLREFAKKQFPKEYSYIETLTSEELWIKVARSLGEDDVQQFFHFFGGAVEPLVITCNAYIVLEREKKRKKRNNQKE